MMFFSLRHKITLTYGLLFIVILLTLGTWLSGVFARQYEDTLEDTLKNNARLMADLVTNIELEDLETFTGKVSRELDLRVTVIDTTGVPLSETARPVEELENHGTRPEVKTALNGEVGMDRRFSSTVNAEMLYLAAPIRGADGEIIGVMRLSHSLAEIAAAASRIRVIIFGSMLAGLVAFWLLGWLISRAITRSIDILTRKARDFGAGSFNYRTEVQTQDEIGELEQVFNDMARGILESMAKHDRGRERVEHILRYLPIGVLVIDQDGSLVAANNTARDILNVDLGGEGKPLTHLTRNWQVNNFVASLLDKQDDIQQEVTLDTDLGRQYIRMRGAAVQDSEVVVVLQDVTDLRLLEQQRKDLVANVSHELRTPLTAIQGFTETLMDESIDIETTKHFLNIIRQESIRLSRLINDLLNLSRLESGQKRKSGASNLKEVARDTVDLLSEVARARGKELRVEITQDIWLEVDRDYVEQILMNYIDNAIKYTPEGTQIRVGAEIQDNGFVRIVVVDDGPGITADEQARLFQRFFRVERSRGREAGGTGLGLSIVKHIVEGFGGEVGVVSHPGSGTSFWATLPIKDTK